jgi:hypothetical protein
LTLTIPAACEWLVARGFQRKDGQGENNSYVPPADGRYWTLLPATESLDGQSWLWIYDQGDNDISLTLAANPSGAITTAHVFEGFAGTAVAIAEPVSRTLEQLLSDRTTIAAGYFLTEDSQFAGLEALLPAGWSLAEVD